MRKAQGSLEYLIIVAAVLAIAAVVVLFLSGAFKGAGGGGTTSVCKQTAASCALTKQTTMNYNCTSSCVTSCTTAAGKDVLASGITPSPTNCVTNGAATGCALCSDGNASQIG